MSHARSSISTRHWVKKSVLQAALYSMYNKLLLYVNINVRESLQANHQEHSPNSDASFVGQCCLR